MVRDLLSTYGLAVRRGEVRVFTPYLAAGPARFGLGALGRPSGQSPRDLTKAPAFDLVAERAQPVRDPRPSLGRRSTWATGTLRPGRSSVVSAVRCSTTAGSRSSSKDGFHGPRHDLAGGSDEHRGRRTRSIVGQGRDLHRRGAALLRERLAVLEQRLGNVIAGHQLFAGVHDRHHTSRITSGGPAGQAA